MLSTPWAQHKNQYDVVIIGSGYGGAITAARLASADINPKPTICILERGKEWQARDFSETLSDGFGGNPSDLNPLGLYEMVYHPHISGFKSSGMGWKAVIKSD